MNRPKFIVYAPSYNTDVGGIIAMHKLCHILRRLGYEAFLQPYTKPKFVSGRILYYYFSAEIPMIARLIGRGYRRNRSFNTPLLPLGVDMSPNDSITIYPEIAQRNPLQARHVVRWFLHKPGFHTGAAEFGEGEYHIDFNQFLLDYDVGNNFLSENRLHVVHYPLDVYDVIGALPRNARAGIAYCVRKGKIDPTVDLTDAICIDGLSHDSIAAIFKRVRMFISFDLYTAYSSFAALCGAVSIVIPPRGLSKEAWYPAEIDRLGIGFGLSEVEWARATMEKVRPTLEERERASVDAVSVFAEEAAAYFGFR